MRLTECTDLITGVKAWLSLESGSGSSTSPWTARWARPWPPTGNKQSRSPWGPSGLRKQPCRYLDAPVDAGEGAERGVLGCATRQCVAPRAPAAAGVEATAILVPHRPGRAIERRAQSALSLHAAPASCTSWSSSTRLNTAVAKTRSNSAKRISPSSAPA